MIPLGDIARASQPRSSSLGALFAVNNRNTRVIAVDLKQLEARPSWLVSSLAAKFSCTTCAPTRPPTESLHESEE